MDAVKFIEESNRMCKSFVSECKGCPEAALDDYGVLRFCPSDISAAHRDSPGCGYPELRCTDCRRKFWMKEVE